MRLTRSKPYDGWDRLLGISRVARVTGLDRAGLEVACAIRPGGHVLQVCNGKGGSWAQAALSARMETAELWAAERVEERRLQWGTAGELKARRGEPVLSPAELATGEGVSSAVDATSLPCAFIHGTELFSGQRAWVPAWAVHCPPQGGPLLGVALAPWTTNGMGAHPEAPAALSHALFEAAERHVLAERLPEGWTEAAVHQHLLAKAELARRWPFLLANAERLGRVGLNAFFFDLTPGAGKGLRVPTAAVLLFDSEQGPMPLAAGYASAPTLGAALQAALLEAAQSRLTDIHGAREDVAPQDVEAVKGFAELCVKAREAVRPAPARREARPLTVPALLRQLRREGLQNAVAVELAPRGAPFHVIKVIAPGLEVSFLL